MNITSLGNCQTKALSWYIQQLDPSFNVKWICIEMFLTPLGSLDHNLDGKPINVITDTQEAIKTLQSSDHLIFQPLKTETPPRITTQINLIKYACNIG